VEMVLDQLSLRELTLFEKGSLTELKETLEEEKDDEGSLKVAKVAVAQANAMFVCVSFVIVVGLKIE
jgi:hypothetical protein